ncbi:uncharacterized protein CIMG_02865 [Coccidioides immitis RS]|uniref:Uncharacterized protein n=1 Tax=Coccidioides immitis (strain RS) TaxID=246410 RepID=J3KM95_COCIM|nr:uncharacterized protein CIMG_02865 [Coccidioides immitis RS]EAS37511.3 hypothetical protein CIMG_02865 [Coccidioides immitis RS]
MSSASKTIGGVVVLYLHDVPTGAKLDHELKDVNGKTPTKSRAVPVAAAMFGRPHLRQYPGRTKAYHASTGLRVRLE